MPLLRQGCLGEEHVERLATGQTAEPGVREHLEECAGCRRRLAQAQEDAQFLNKARGLAGAVLGPEGALRVPGYRVLERLSSGSQGVVYRAVQESTQRVVAVKVLGAADEREGGSSRDRVRAEREAEIAARLQHPSVVSVFESRKLGDGRIAVIMEYVDGVPMDQWVPKPETEPDRIRAVLRVFMQVCSAVHHAHLNGVIHRDLKPENILVTRDGRPVVLDFGVARADGLRTTQTGEFAGTPAYASPEQVAGRPGEVDALTDVYSLGVILYRLLCGNMPYELHGSLLDVAQTIAESEPIPPTHHVPTVDRDLEAIALRALRKHKAGRYQSAASLARDIERFLDGAPVEARSGSGWYVLRKAVAMNRGRLAWASALALVAGGAIVAVVLSVVNAHESDLRADQQRDQARAVGEFMREIVPTAPESAAAGPNSASAVNAGLHRLHYRLETGGFAEEPGVDQVLRQIWGGLYANVSDARASILVPYAEVSLRSGLVQLRMKHGRAHPDIAAMLHGLAGVLRVRGRLAEAEQSCREALDMRTELLGPKSVEVANSRLLLAHILRDEGRADEALEEAEHAEEYFQSSTDLDAKLGLATSAAFRAGVYMEQNRLADAAPLVVEALSLRLGLLAPDDPDVLAVYERAATVVSLTQHPALSSAFEAAYHATGPELVTAVAADCRTLEQTSPQLRAGLLSQSKTGALMRMLEFQKVLLPGDESAQIRLLLAVMTTAGEDNQLSARCDAALEAADLLAKRFGPMDMRQLACLDEAGTMLVFAGEPEHALEVSRRCLAIRDAVPEVARDRLMHANTQRVVAWCLALTRNFPDAIPAYQTALAPFTNLLTQDHYLVALAQAGLAYCLAETGNISEADALSASAMESAARSSAISNDQLCHIRFVRGHVLVATGHPADGLPLLEQAWSDFYQYLAPNFQWGRASVRDGIRASEAVGDLALVEVWRTRETLASPRTR